MKKVVLIAFLTFGLLGLTENIFGQGLYKWVDEKGTIHFSDNPPSAVSNQDKEPSKENGIEVLKRSETANQQGNVVGSKGTSIKIGYSQSSGGSSGGGSTTIIRSGRS
jgi:hypothetical protein